LSPKTDKLVNYDYISVTIIIRLDFFGLITTLFYGKIQAFNWRS